MILRCGQLQKMAATTYLYLKSYDCQNFLAGAFSLAFLVLATFRKIY